MGDYEKLRGERGRVNVLHHLGAAQVYVEAALSYAKHTLRVMRESGIGEVERAIGKLEEARGFLAEAERVQGYGDVDNLSTST